MKKRILSILLSVAVAIAMIPATGAVAFAQDGSLFIGTVEVTSSNASDILGDGTMSYDAASSTLKIKGSGAVVSADNVSGRSGIIYTSGDLTIDVAANSILDVKGTSSITAGIYVGGNLTVTGTGKVIASTSGDKTPLKVMGDLINKGNIETAISGMYGTSLSCDGTIENTGTITGSTEKATGTGILANHDFKNSGTVTLNEKFAYGILVSNGAFSQDKGSIVYKGSDTAAMGIECESFNLTGGSIDLSSVPLGINVLYDDGNAFNMSGGNLTINTGINYLPESQKAILIYNAPVSMTGGTIEVTANEGTPSYGIAFCDCPDINISSTTITAKINGANTSFGTIVKCSLYYNEAEGIVEYRDVEGLTFNSDLKITASKNADATDAEAYDPANVPNGYKYLQVLHEHSWDSGAVTTKPTCTEPGTKTFTCTGCKATRTEEIAAAGHTSVAIAAKKATTGADGATAGTKCSVCGKVLTAPKTIYKASTVKLAAASKVYTGKALKPAVTIKDSKGNAIASANYSIKYANNTKVGKASATVTFKNNYSGTKKLTFKINPKKAAVKSAVPGKKSLKVTAGTKVAATGGDKYKIAYKVKGTSTWKYKTTANKTLTIKSLKKGKKYQVKIQAIKTVNGTTYAGAWSTIKTSNKIK